jgi:hypothetical protein
MQEAAPPQAVDLGHPLAFLVGSWRTRRDLLDRSTGTAGSFVGTTTFTSDGEGLLWEERGTVSWPHFEGPASRSYAVRAAGPAMTLHFPDGRLLCRLDLRTGEARDEHDCFPDTYRVTFRVTTRETIEYSWDVTGPDKDILLRTALTRLP